MPRANLTTASVERLKPPRAGQTDYFDRRLPSFGLRLSYHGAKSWFVMARLDGRLVRFTLGKHPALSLADARKEARNVMELTAVGRDPRRMKEEEEQKRRRERQNTYEGCANEFIEKHAQRRLRPSTQREYRRILLGPDTRRWRDRPITQIGKRDVLDVIEAIDRRGSPGAAKRVLVYLRKFFNWCAERDIISAPPTDRIRPPHPEVKRDRVLSEEELRYLLRALQAEQTIFGRAIHLLLLTGQRRAEVAGMRWSELRDLETEAAIWEIPGERTKNKQRHLVPLSASAVAILKQMPRSDELVFTTTGATPISGFGKAKARIDARTNALREADVLAEVEAWTLHDLRRTMVTMMNEKLGILPHVVEAVVNHISGLAKAGVAGVYNRALYLDERRRALDAWARYIHDLPA